MNSLLIIVFLLAANAFFVAVEFALVKARRFRLDAMVAEGRFAAELTCKIVDNLESYLAACQLGITMASLGLGWVGEPAVASLLEPIFTALELPEQSVHTISFLIGFIAFSSLHIVIGEQVPKTFAIRQAEPVSTALAYPLHAFYIVMYPLNWLLNRASSGILRLAGVEEATHGDVLTGEELKSLVNVSQAHGAIADEQATMLNNLFAFDGRSVARVMIPRRDVDILDLSASLEANQQVLRGSRHSRIPVVDGSADVPVGVILVKDLYRSLLAGESIAWDRLDELCRPPLVVPDTMRVATLFETMRSERDHMSLVVDEYGSFIGIVTLEDLLEEIVGDIIDESEPTAAQYPIEALAEHDWSAHGLASISDIERSVGLQVPDELEANTLSGLFLSRLARMPEVGDVIREGEFELTVESMEAHHVARVSIHREPGAESAPHSDQHDKPPN